MNMSSTNKPKQKNLAASVAITVGVGVAIGATMGSYLIGMLIMLPVGIALYQRHQRPTQ